MNFTRAARVVTEDDLYVTVRINKTELDEVTRMPGERVWPMVFLRWRHGAPEPFLPWDDECSVEDSSPDNHHL